MNFPVLSVNAVNKLFIRHGTGFAIAGAESSFDI
jgi:hypothetical protein